MKTFILVFISSISFGQHLGEVPVSGFRAYYKLENANDATANAYTLTNNNSVPFNRGKFTNGADFGTSGTNKGLIKTGSPLSAVSPSQLYISFWFKLNDAATGGGIVFAVVSAASATLVSDGLLFQVSYSFSAGDLVLRCRLGGSASDQLITMPANTNWHFMSVAYTSSSANFIVDRNYSATCTFASFSGNTTGIRIGNNSALNSQAWMIIDEFILTEDNVLGNVNTNPGRGHRIKYYTQAKGRFVH